MFTEQQFNQLCSQLETRLAGRLEGKAQTAQAQLQRFSEEIAIAEKKRGVEALTDRFVREGRVIPRNRDAVYDRLMRADARAVVRKFTENGKEVGLTEFDLQVRELETLPTLFAERMRSPVVAGEYEDAEVEKVATNVRMYSEQYSANGHSVETVVTAFKLERDAKKKEGQVFTAEKFLNG
jgi:hypothetical protein